MGVSIIVGGQYGSEGKGKVAYWFAMNHDIAACVRPGGPNSGHTVVTDAGRQFVLRALPTGCIGNPSILAIIPAGAYINVDILLKEIKLVNRSPENLIIDPNAVVISDDHITYESKIELRKNVGSTLSGTGGALIERISRRSGQNILASHCKWLYPYIGDTVKCMRGLLNEDKNILIEGTQGFGLSLLHSNCYPFCTARDTTAAGFLSETGLSPLDVDNIIMVIRSYPIRVGGHSGPLHGHLSWEEITRSSGSLVPIEEYTSVTHTLRRVARFDPILVKQAIQSNKPNIVVMNHADYFDYSMHDMSTISSMQDCMIADIESKIGRHIDYIGNGSNIIIQR